MRKILLTAVIFAVSALPACATLPTKEAECRPIQDASLEHHRTDDVRISLPVGSRLTAENTIDARYWTWQTSQGNVSVTWIGEIAREIRETDRAPSCTLNAKNAKFKVYVDARKVVAVSESLTKSGAGLLIEIESSDMKANLPVVLAIIQSIQVTIKPER